MDARLLGAVIAGLGAPHCAQPARDAALGMVEAILDYGDEAAEKVLGSCMGGLLEGLREVAVAGSRAKPKSGGKAKKVCFRSSLFSALMQDSQLSLPLCVA